MATPRWSPGDTILFRQWRGGKIAQAMPAIMVLDSPELLAIWIPPGTPYKRCEGLNGARINPTDLACSRWRLNDRSIYGEGILKLKIPGARYSVMVFWETGFTALRSWYINLEEPDRRTPMGFDGLDQWLDVVVAPDRKSWRWKDEDEFEEAQRAGLLSAEQAETIRAAGVAAIAHVLTWRPPFEELWAHWRPDPSWRTPSLPPGWDTAG